MVLDPLMTADLATLLKHFTNDDLHGIVSILKQHTSWSPFPVPRATVAHNVEAGGDMRRHADAIAVEILWWGSNDLHFQFGEERTWLEVVKDTARSAGVPENERDNSLPVWRIEGALLTKVLKNWEALTPKQREEALRKAGFSTDAARGGMGVAVGAAARLGGPQLLALIGVEGAGIAFAAALLAPIAAALGAVWAAYDLAGPGYRVLRPVVLIIALTRQRLRDQRASDGFKD